MAWMVHLTLGSHSLALLLFFIPFTKLWKIHSLPRMSYVLWYKMGVHVQLEYWLFASKNGTNLKHYFLLIRRNAIFKVLLFMITNLSTKLPNMEIHVLEYLLKWCSLLITVICEFFVVKNFILCKVTKFFTRKWFTYTNLYSEYMAHS